MTAKWLILCEERWFTYKTFSEINKHNVNIISVSTHQQLDTPPSLISFNFYNHHEGVISIIAILQISKTEAKKG